MSFRGKANCNSATSERFTFCISKEVIITQWEGKHSKCNLAESDLNSLGRKKELGLLMLLGQLTH